MSHIHHSPWAVDLGEARHLGVGRSATRTFGLSGGDLRLLLGLQICVTWRKPNIMELDDGKILTGKPINLMVKTHGFPV
jgi:hypothetical protein